MTKFNPLNFVANHAGMNLADAIKEAYEQGKRDAQPEPKSPLYYGDGYSEGKMVYDSAECPNCGYIYDEGDQVWGEPYCPHCGQALDWYMRGEQDG